MKTDVAMRGALLLLAAAVLAAGLILFNDRRMATHWGLLYEANSGRVILVEQNTTAANAGLKSGDTLTAIALRPLGDTAPVTGDLLPVSEHENGMIGVRWLTRPPPGLPWSLTALLLVAATLWLVGLLVGLLGPGIGAARLFALFAMAAALALACASAQDPPIAWAQWLLAPATLAAMIAYIWLQRALIGHIPIRRPIMAELVLSGQGLVVTAVLLGGPRLLGPASGPVLDVVVGLDLPLMLIASHALVYWRLHQESAVPVRRRARLALLVGLLAWLPALAIGWAPIMAGLLTTGTMSPLTPYGGALSLLVLPITYPTILARGDLYALELAVRRGAVSLVVGGILLGIVSGLFWAVDTTLHPSPKGRIATGAVLLLLALPIFEPSRRLLQGFLERNLMTGQPDYSTALEELGDALLVALDESDIARVLTGHAQALLGIITIRAWLRGSNDRWLLCEVGTVKRVLEPPPILLSLPGRSLPPMRQEPDATTPVLELQAAPAPPADRPFAPPADIAATGVVLCVPIHINEELRGLLLLGPRRSQDPYRRPDREALVLLARQVAAALQLVDRMADLRARNAELALLTGRLARAREEERKHLSHELHDEVAQDLVAITRQLRRHQQAPVPEAIWQDMIAQTQEALTAIRRICNDLRPAILDMGLASALRELVDRPSQMPQLLRIQLDLQGDEQRLDEEREFALYRVTQEALANVVKHAEATEVTVTLCFGLTYVEVRISDNGRGFLVPHRLEEITGDHLGLLGMRERLAGLGGQVAVESQPGQGTVVRARIPYPA